MQRLIRGFGATAREEQEVFGFCGTVGGTRNVSVPHISPFKKTEARIGDVSPIHKCYMLGQLRYICLDWMFHSVYL